METRSDEIKAEMEKLEVFINHAIGKAERAQDPETAILWLDYGKRMEKRKASLREQLNREEACLIRPQPKGVKIGGIDV